MRVSTSNQEATHSDHERSTTSDEDKNHSDRWVSGTGFDRSRVELVPSYDLVEGSEHAGELEEGGFRSSNASP